MSHSPRLLPGVVLGLLLLTPGPAAAQRCPYCMNMWANFQRQQFSSYSPGRTQTSFDSYPATNYRQNSLWQNRGSSWNYSNRSAYSTSFQRPGGTYNQTSRYRWQSEQRYYARLRSTQHQESLTRHYLRIVERWAPYGRGHGPGHAWERSRTITTVRHSASDRQRVSYQESLTRRRGTILQSRTYRRPGEQQTRTRFANQQGRGRTPPSFAGRTRSTQPRNEPRPQERSLPGISRNRTSMQAQVRVDFTCSRCHASNKPTVTVLQQLPNLQPSRPMTVPAPVQQIPSVPLLPSRLFPQPADVWLASRAQSPLLPALAELRRRQSLLQSQALAQSALQAQALLQSQLQARALEQSYQRTQALLEYFRRAESQAQADAAHSSPDGPVPSADERLASLEPPALPPLPADRTLRSAELPAGPSGVPDPDGSAPRRQVVLRPPPLPPLPSS